MSERDIHGFDPDDIGRSRGGRARPKAAGRLALRALLQRLAWADYRLVYWTGAPAPAEPCTATHAVQDRLKTKPCGLYAVSLSRRDGSVRVRTFERFVDAVSPAVAEVIPVNLSLIAASLRRLADAQRFPALLPRLLNDPAAWRSGVELALRRARAAIDAANRDDDSVGRACLILGESLPLRRSRSEKPPAARARLSGDTHGAPDGPRYSGLRQALSAWPDDVVREAARVLGGDKPLRLAAAIPGANDDAVASAVRDRLLFCPRGLGAFLASLPVLLGLYDRLADEPRRRLHAAVAIQRKALSAALSDTGLTGNVARAFDPDHPGRVRALEFFHQSYPAYVAEALADRFFPVLPQAPAPPAPRKRGRSPLDVVECLQDLLAARHICAALFSDPDRLARQGRLARVKFIDRQRHLVTPSYAEPLTFENLVAAAAQALWDRAQPALSPPSRRMFLAMAAADAVPLASALPNWIELCCEVWPPGQSGYDHFQVVLLALHTAYTRAAPGREAETLAAIDRLAAPMLRRLLSQSSVTDRSNRVACDQVVAGVAFICQAIGAGLTADDLSSAFADEQVAAIEVILERAPGAAVKFLGMLRTRARSWAKGAEAPGARRARLVAWDMVGDVCRYWATTYLKLGVENLNGVLDVLTSASVTSSERLDLLSGLGEFVLDGAPSPDVLARPEAAAGIRDRREFLAAALPVLRDVIRRIPPEEPVRVARALVLFDRCLAVAHAAAGQNWPDPHRLLGSSLRALARDAGDPSATFFRHYTGGALASLVALARGRLERLLNLGACVGDMDLREIEQFVVAWQYLQRFEPLAEAVSSAAARHGVTARAMRLLARLGLCLRLRRKEQLDHALSGLLAPVAVASAGAVAPVLTSERQRALDELPRWRPDGLLPKSILEVLHRPEDLESELLALQGGASLTPTARRRAEHLRQLLADKHSLAEWVGRDLDKLVAAALDEARLGRLEGVAESAVAGHFIDILGASPPTAHDARHQRNWDNALRLYFSIDANRALLRRLLAHEARGDRSWLREQPDNARFLREISSLGIDAEAWLAPMSGQLALPAGAGRIEIETDPLHVLQMGNYFDTCLSEGQFNSFATVANAVELNKRVLYAYGRDGAVIGRKLIALTREGQVVGFRTYGRFPRARPKPVEGDGPDAALKAAFDDFCRDLADRCGARLHAYPQEPLPEIKGKRDPLALFAKWYNDGAEPFDRRVLGGARGRPIALPPPSQ